ncbi:peptidoglycan-binding domain-containing protein [Stenomitos frigidus]|uniref:Peptidoglycan-binding protein n=1 Tax=Stenomitos frigidus ULC18 TaxID=2107698 RepID=A0A2T1E5Z7_9CYAN|nr:peptidoglycan-binding domain-containing protein [Stenomitos frigidus]PSB28115.1 peptidoglycan-binding protein [Stenomitos frigidus ULC18]
MGNTRATSSKLQTLTFGLLRRTALSLLAVSLGYTALVHVTTASAFSQVTGAATTDTTGTAPTSDLIRPTLKPGSRGAEVTELQAALKLLGYYGGTVDGFYGQSTVSAVSQFQQAAGLGADGITGPATWNRLFPAAAEIPSTLPTATATVPNPAVNTVAPAVSGSASFPVPAGASPTPSSSKPTSSSRPAAKPAPVKVSPTPTKPAAEARPVTANTPTTASVTLPTLKQGMKGSAVLALQERLRSLGLFKGTGDGVFGAETLTAVKAAQRRFKLEPDGVVGAATWSALLR